MATRSFPLLSIPRPRHSPPQAQSVGAPSKSSRFLGGRSWIRTRDLRHIRAASLFALVLLRGLHRGLHHLRFTGLRGTSDPRTHAVFAQSSGA
jgi:hypothetical protein